MNSRHKILAFVGSAFLAGVLIGLSGSSWLGKMPETFHQLRQEKEALALTLDGEIEKRNKLQADLARIATVDLADYQRLQNEEAQFKKAKEILGKVFLLLFHNVLTDVKTEQMQLAQEWASTDSESPIPAPPAATAVSESPSLQPRSVEPPKIADASWNQAEKNVSEVNANKPENFLKSVVIKDIMSEQNGSRSFRNDDSRLQMMQGYYSGDLIYKDPKRKQGFIEFTLTSETKDGANSGHFMVRVVDDAGRQSRMTEESNIGGIVQPVSASRALIIRIDKTEFLQLYVFENQGLIIGNYYNEIGGGKVEHLGHFKLMK